jgi:hypothetical protein
MEKILPSFSLFSMVLLTTIVALAVGLYASGRRNSELHAVNEQLAAKNKDYRNQLGIFEIEDPAKIHSIRVPTESDQPQKCRIYLPPGRKYASYYKANGIPENGVPPRQNAEELSPGEYVFSVRIEREKDAKTGEPLPYASVRIERKTERHHNATFVGIGEEKNDWILNKETGEPLFQTSGRSNEVRLSDPSEALVVFIARACRLDVRQRDASGKPTRWSAPALPGEVDGFMLWIESEPLPTP